MRVCFCLCKEGCKETGMPALDALRSYYSPSPRTRALYTQSKQEEKTIPQQLQNIWSQTSWLNLFCCKRELKPNPETNINLYTVLQKHIRIFTSAVIYHSDGCITQKFTDMQQYKLRDESRCSGPYCTTIQEDEAQVWKGGVSWEEGHATQVIQLKVYRPWYPEFSASVKEKFYHNVNKWDPLEGASSVLSKHIKPGTTKC